MHFPETEYKPRAKGHIHEVFDVAVAVGLCNIQLASRHFLSLLMPFVASREYFQFFLEPPTQKEVGCTVYIIVEPYYASLFALKLVGMNY